MDHSSSDYFCTKTLIGGNIENPISCPEFQCRFDKLACLMVCLHNSFSLAAVCEFLHVYLYFFYWPVFVSFFLSVFVVSCLSCTLLICSCAGLAYLTMRLSWLPKRIRSHVKGNHFDRRMALKSS